MKLISDNRSFAPSQQFPEVSFFVALLAQEFFLGEPFQIQTRCVINFGADVAAKKLSSFSTDGAGLFPIELVLSRIVGF